MAEGNDDLVERFTQLDLRIREQHLETQQILHALVEGQRLLVDGQRNLSADVRDLSGEIKGLAGEIKGLALDLRALVARIDALIRGRNNGEPPV